MRVIYHPRRPSAYTCRDCHRVSRGQADVDHVVETLLARRLAQPDVLQLLSEAAGDDGEAREAAAEVTRLRGKLAAARQAWDDDRIFLEAYSDLEARTLSKIRAAEERARPRSLRPVVYAVAGPEAAQRWKALDVTDRRALLAALVDVTIMPVGRGQWRFDPERVVIRWRGRADAARTRRARPSRGPCGRRPHSRAEEGPAVPVALSLALPLGGRWPCSPAVCYSASR